MNTNHFPCDRRQFLLSAAAGAVAFRGKAAWGEDANLSTEKVTFSSQNEDTVPQLFRLPSDEYLVQMQEVKIASPTIELWDVHFPSPIQSPVPQNNTVHTEYYRPRGKGKHPAVIVLHILGGDFALARLFANCFAQQGIAALFLKMPYYGPRRGDSPRRMISTDPQQTVEGMTQAIGDIRRATHWLASREEIDADKLGVFGISLGGITGALALGIESRLQRGCLLLAGGDIGQVAWEAKMAAAARREWEAQGKTKAEFLKILEPIDPVRYAERAKGKQILMLNALSDEVIPKACTESLWQSFGKPKIEWFSGGHYSVAVHLPRALGKAAVHFTERK